MAHFRHPKLLDERLALHGNYVLGASDVQLGCWRSLMPTAKQLCVDVGCGKGLWTTAAANAWQDSLFVGIDHELMCISFAAEQAAVGGVASSGWAKSPDQGFVPPTNLRFVCAPAADIGTLFAPGEIDHLFLNYPTPFPKKKETARRTVNVDHLRIYERLLSPNGVLHFKTDSQPLFDYALDQLKLTRFEVIALTRDLYGTNSELSTKTGQQAQQGQQAQNPLQPLTSLALEPFDDVDKLPSAYERKTLMRGAKIHALHARLKSSANFDDGFAGSLQMASEVSSVSSSAASSTPFVFAQSTEPSFAIPFAPICEPISLYDYLPDDLDSITYVPLGMENALLNMRNRRKNGHGGVWGQQ